MKILVDRIMNVLTSVIFIFLMITTGLVMANDMFAPNSSQSKYESRKPTLKSLKADVELKANKGAFEFNGLDQTLNLGNSSILHMSKKDFTVLVWVKFNSLTEGGPPCYGPGCDMRIVDKMTGFVNLDGWALLKQSSNQFYFCLGGGNSDGCGQESSSRVVSNTIVEPNVWYFLTAKKTSNTLSLYVNGDLDKKVQLGNFTDTDSTDLLVGSNKIEGCFLNGKIDHVALFHRALSDGQIKAIYNKNKDAHKR